MPRIHVPSQQTAPYWLSTATQIFKVKNWEKSLSLDVMFFFQTSVLSHNYPVTPQPMCVFRYTPVYQRQGTLILMQTDTLRWCRKLKERMVSFNLTPTGCFFSNEAGNSMQRPLQTKHKKNTCQKAGSLIQTTQEPQIQKATKKQTKHQKSHLTDDKEHFNIITT